MKIGPYHWRHYVGGTCLVLLVAQLASGTFLALFYQPHLNEAYASVQYLYKSFSSAAWVRDSHRWIALLLFVFIVVHTVQSILRLDYLKYERRAVWLAGALLLLPLLALLATGSILPWEWKGYWFMEMVPNYLGTIPVIGPPIQEFLIDAFTANRNFIAHVVILPAISIVLIDIHAFGSIRKLEGGIPRFLLRHGVIALPVLVAAVLLAVMIPMPTEDPEIVPMPLEGSYIPAPEWFLLILFLPFLYFKGAMGPMLAVLVPFVLFVVLTCLPYIFRNPKRAAAMRATGGLIFRLLGRFVKVSRGGLLVTSVAFLAVLLVAGAVLGPLYAGTYRSPTLGCNSCHNVLMGTRMGIPPKAFKDRKIVPLLGNNQWMVEHWFYPQVAW